MRCRCHLRRDGLAERQASCCHHRVGPLRSSAFLPFFSLGVILRKTGSEKAVSTSKMVSPCLTTVSFYMVSACLYSRFPQTLGYHRVLAGFNTPKAPKLFDLVNSFNTRKTTPVSAILRRFLPLGHGSKNGSLEVTEISMAALALHTCSQSVEHFKVHRRLWADGHPSWCVQAVEGGRRGARWGRHRIESR